MRALICFLVLFSIFFECSAQAVKITSAPSWLVKSSFIDDKKTAADEVSNGYTLALYERQVNLADQSVFMHIKRRIYNETGVQNASEVSVSFAPQYEHVNIHYIKIIRNGGVVYNLHQKDIKVVEEEAESDEFLYNERKRAFVILKGVEKNDEIDFAYTIAGFNPVFGKHYSDKIYFASGLQIENYFQTLIVPASTNISFKTYNDAPHPKETRTGDNKIYEWLNPPIGEWKWKSGSPSWYEAETMISFTTFQNWKEVIDWGARLFKDYKYPLPAKLHALIEEWRKKSGGNKDKFATMATEFVQEKVRYLGLEIGTNSHEPHPPAEIFDQRFGDCKDKSLLLSMILRQENIESYVALVDTEEKKMIGEALPSAITFDHAIVAVRNEDGNGYRFVDPTITGQRGPFSNLYVPEYGFALVLNPSETGLQVARGSSVNRIEVAETFRLSYNDSSKLKVTTKYYGKSADRTRDELRGTSIKELGKSYQDFYAKLYESINLSRPVAVTDDSAINELKIDESYAVASAWVKDKGRKKAFNFIAQVLFDKLPNPSDHPDDAPMWLEYPLNYVYTVQMYMPEEWPQYFVPEHIKNDYYQFDFTPRVDGKIIYLEYYFATFKDHIPASMVKTYKADYEKINNEMSFALTSTPESPKTRDTPRDPVSITTLALFVLFLGILVLLVVYLNERSVPVQYDENAAWSIQGWLIVLGISLGVKIIYQSYLLFSSGYFMQATWDALRELGGVGLQGVAVFEMMAQEFSLVFGVVLLIWFLRRRDIFPVMFTWFVGILLVSQFLLMGMYMYYKHAFPGQDLVQTQMTNVIQILIYGAIWVTYIQRSDRSKYTFLISFSRERSVTGRHI
ncbi:DUF3857 domain-containing protein [Pollutibacter soli]|uniref:DUF3857 domain-containing protein n=1 Tax=Pollutibacter soli TaxID=3034157 RepID=UPI0030132F7A